MKTLFPPFLLNGVKYFSMCVVIRVLESDGGRYREAGDDTNIGGLWAGTDAGLRPQCPQAASGHTSRCHGASDWSGRGETPPAIGCREVSLVAGAELAQFENRTLLVYILLLQGHIPR